MVFFLKVGDTFKVSPTFKKKDHSHKNTDETTIEKRKM